MSAKVKFDRGAWWVITHYDSKRRKHRVGPTDKHKSQADEIARKVNAAIILGTYDPDASRWRAEPKAMLCKAELQRWHLNDSPTLKPSYRKSSGDVIRLHLAPFFGPMDVREIREEHLLDYVQTKLAAKRPSETEGSERRSALKPATIRLHLAILRRVLGLLEREGKIPKNPARGIGELLRRVGRSFASETEEVEHWTRGEVEALIRLARVYEPRFAPLLALLFATGSPRRGPRPPVVRRGPGLPGPRGAPRDHEGGPDHAEEWEGAARSLAAGAH